jgi:hypothetical protein
MPDQLGKLTKDDEQKLLDWLKEKCGGIPACPVCRRKSWVVGEQLSIMMVSTGYDVLLGDANYPCVVFACKNCSNTLLFNAVYIGLIPPVRKEP